jgi:branched-chain amino acid aminotransferase
LAHTASLSQLQTPRFALVNGVLRPYEDVRIHIGAEALTRALSVFEGMKGYWNHAGETFSVRNPRLHYDRLCRSAALFHIPIRFSYSDFLEGLQRLADELLDPERDLWFRPTLYVTRGHWGEATEADLVTTAFTQQKHDPDPMKLGVSTWRRAPDVALPARVKCSANYVMARLARIEARRLGYDDAVLLNTSGRVAEATGACILVVSGGRIISPPTSEGCLDSITVAVIEEVCRDMGLVVERRPIERSELLAAEECGVAGTISELTLVDEVDGFHFSTEGVLAEVRAQYIRVMRGEAVLPGVDMVELAHGPAVDLLAPAVL